MKMERQMMENTTLKMTDHQGIEIDVDIRYKKGNAEYFPSFGLCYIDRADQFEYVMYGKVYKIEGDETSTEAATRL